MVKTPATDGPTRQPTDDSLTMSMNIMYEDTERPTEQPNPDPTQSTVTPSPPTFSAETSIRLDGISETMDDDAASALEDVTRSFLNDQFSDSMEVDDVTVLSQRVVVPSPGGRRLGRGRRRLQGGDGEEEEDGGGAPPSASPSTSPYLLVELGVEGTVSNWTALEYSSSRYSANDTSGGTSVEDSISAVIAESISSNYDELTAQLADESDFFPYESSDIVYAPAELPNAAIQEGNPNRLVFLVSGAAVALVVLIGSIFYMDRRSAGEKRRRMLDEDASLEDRSAYDLNNVTNGSDCDDDDDRGNDINASMRMINNSRHRRGDGGSHSRGGGDGTRSRGGASRSRGSVSRARSSRPRDAEGEENKKNAAQMTSLLDGADSNDTDVKEMSALNFSPEQLKAAIKKKERNIFVFTDDKQSSLGNREGGGDDMLELKHGVLSLSNPSQIEEPFSPSPHGGYLGDHFNYTNVEKMIGDQYDTRAIMTPFTPKGSGSGTPSRRTNYSFSSPLSKTSTQRGSSRKDKLFDVYAPPGPLGIIIDTTPEGPMIHSLKPTSQLSGLVSPGDLIVGLDGVDTRNMTVATFTRLMAKRSQGERKITLLKGLAPPLMTPTASTPK